MRAAVFAAPRTIQIAEMQPAQPAPPELLVRLEGCGVCGSNLPLWQGRPWFSYPIEGGRPGHEGWGIVDGVGAEVVDIRPGDRVACLAERAFADYALVRAADAVRLPPALNRMPVPGEPLGCAMNVIRRSALEAGQTVVIIGIGFLGALLVAMARDAGARVIAVSRRQFALDIARRCGAHECFPLESGSDAGDAVRKLTGGRGAERVIEAAGLQSTLDLASDLTAEHGRLIIAGYHQDGMRHVNLQQWNWRGLDVINAHERHRPVQLEGIRLAVEWLQRTTIDVDALYTHRVGLDDLGTVFELMERRPDGFLKGLMVT